MWSALRSYARLYSGNRWALTGVVLLTAFATLAVVPIPLLIKKALDVAIPEKRVALLFGLGALLVGLQVANAVATVVRRRVVTAQTKAATRRLREAMIRKFYDTSIDYHRSAEIGTLQDWAVQETSRVDGMADSLLSGFIPALATSIGISVVLIVLNWQLYFLTMAVVPIIVLWHRTVMRGVRAANQRFRRAFRRYSDHVLFVLRTMDLTRIRAAEDLEMERSQRRLLDLEESDWSVTNARAMYSAGQQTLVAVSGIIILVFGGRAVIDGSLTVGDLFAFYAGLAMLKGPLTSTFTALPTIATGGQSLVQVYELLTEPDHRPYEGTDDIEFSGRLSLVDVAFGYGRRPLIRRANLDLVPGRVTALVGLNGSGKSTIVSLMLGLYRPRDGVVLADGKPLQDLDIRTLRRSTGVVPQEPVIISGTIAANITYGSPNATQEEMRRAADLAQATRFVSDMEEGFDSWVTHEGLTLSGGQRQRIAIARALINEPRLLILDEPTNHLDEAILDEMLDTLVTLPTAPAILLISHQAGIDRWAHDVYRIEDGVLRRAESTLNAATTSDGGAHERER